MQEEFAYAPNPTDREPRGMDWVLSSIALGPREAPGSIGHAPEQLGLERPVPRLTKHFLDRVIAGLLLILLAPALLVLAVLVKADGGAAIFGHKRLGHGGKSFRCFKFRTMVPDAEAALQRVLAVNPAARAEWAAGQKLRADPRVTPLGNMLRRTSLDELPQLFNVLRGEMSLVGPRPIVQAEVCRYGGDIGYYYQARPGITGLWQVSGRSNTSYEHRVRHDVDYVRHWSLIRDFEILLRTIPAVLNKDGAV
jgi:undecaprenyl-phosphate galactose phosphotransferase